MLNKVLRAIAYCSFLLMLASCDGDVLWVDNRKIVFTALVSIIFIMFCVYCGLKLRNNRKN